jgi:hypothetical protein
MPPIRGIAAASVKNCRTIRRRLAPSTSRIANSFPRPIQRINGKLPTFPQAINKMRQVAPNNNNAGAFALATISY